MRATNGANPQGPNSTEMTIPTGDPGSGPIKVKYTVFCGAKDSAYSPTRSTVQVATAGADLDADVARAHADGSAGIPGL